MTTSRSPAPDRFATPPGRSHAVCRSYCSKRTDGPSPRIPAGTRASPVTKAGGSRDTPVHEAGRPRPQANLARVSLPAEGGPVDPGTALDAQNQAGLGDPARL